MPLYFFTKSNACFIFTFTQIVKWSHRAHPHSAQKRRDLFDLYWALTAPSVTPVSAAEMVDAFMHYMHDEDTYMPISEFQTHLHECLADKVGFCGDIQPLLRARSHMTRN
jgi:hypothetical protein